MWEGQRQLRETENDIKINLLLLIFTEKKSFVHHHHRNWRVWVEELSTYDIEFTVSRSTVVFQQFSGIQRFRSHIYIYDWNRIVTGKDLNEIRQSLFRAIDPNFMQFDAKNFTVIQKSATWSAKWNTIKMYIGRLKHNFTLNLTDVCRSIWHLHAGSSRRYVLKFLDLYKKGKVTQWHTCAGTEVSSKPFVT